MRIQNPDFFLKVLTCFSTSSVYLDISLFLHHSLKQCRTILGITRFSVAADEDYVLTRAPQGYFSVEALWESLRQSGSHLLHSEQIQTAAPLSSRCTPNIQPGQMLLTWRGGSWVELQDWKRSRNVSRGSSSAGAAQSRSWRRCSWHKIRWLCRGSGALRQKEEWSDEVLQFIFR